MNCKISVIMPTYNHAQYIKNAIDSVLKQTLRNFELIIIDNYSTDSTEDIIKSFNDNRIIYKKYLNNGVIAKSRNFGISIANGPWIALIDSDDIWLEDKLHKCHAVAEKYKADLVYHKLYCYRMANGQIQHVGRLQAKNLEKETYKSLLKNGTGLTTSAVMMRLESLKKINGFSENYNLVGGEDYDLWLRLAKAEKKFIFINEYMGSYLIGGNHTTSADKAVKIICYLENVYKKDFEKHKPIWLYKTKIASYVKMRKYKDLNRYIYLSMRNLNIFDYIKILFILIKSIVYRKIFKYYAL